MLPCARLSGQSRSPTAAPFPAPFMQVHIMGQNNLLQRTGFRGGEAELED